MADPVNLVRQMDKSQDDFMSLLSSQLAGMKELGERLKQENADLLAENEALTEENRLLKEGGGDPNAYVEGAPDLPGGISGTIQFSKEKNIKTHSQPVHSVTRAWVPAPGRSTGCLTATASWDKTIQIYDLDNEDENALLATIGNPDGNEEGDMGGLYCVEFARIPDFSHIIGCASADNNGYLWNHETGEFLSRLEGHTNEVNCITFHPTQQVCCTCSDDCLAIIWDFKDAQKIRTLRNHTKEVYSASFMGGAFEFYVATACFDRKVRIFDMRGPSITQELTGHTDDILGIDFSESTLQLASSADDGTICVWDVRQWGEPIFTIDSRTNPGIPGNELKRLGFNQDGTLLAVGCSAHCTLVYDLAGESPVVAGHLAGHSDCVFDVCWGVDDSGAEFLIDASHDNTSFVWRMAG